MIVKNEELFLNAEKPFSLYPIFLCFQYFLYRFFDLSAAAD
jgi:hypothetical protein